MRLIRNRPVKCGMEALGNALLDGTGLKPGQGLSQGTREAILAENLKHMIVGELLFQATVSMPPRLSDLTNNYGHTRVATKEAKVWRSSQEWAVLFKIKEPIDVWCHVWIRLGFTQRQLVGDCANREKAATDLLVHCKVLKDDCAKIVVANHQVWDPSVPAGQAILEVRKA